MIDRPFQRPDSLTGDELNVPINLAPIIDITLLLIIFWLVVTGQAPRSLVRDVDLPAASVKRAAGHTQPIAVDVTTAPVRPIYYAGRAWSAGELADHFRLHRLDGRDVVIRADRRTDAALVSRLTRDCYGSGAASVAFSLRLAGGP